MIKLIVFDLRGTLAYRNVNYKSTHKMLEKTNCNIDKNKFQRIFEEVVQTKNRDNKKDAYRLLCQKMNIEGDDHNINLLMNIRDQAESKIELYPFTTYMLSELKNKYKLGLISNSTASSVNILKNKTNLLSYFDFTIFSYQIGYVKPNLIIFTKILDISKHIPKEILMIGDNFSNDILPAKKLGINTILFQNYNQLKSDLIEYQIKLD